MPRSEIDELPARVEGTRPIRVGEKVPAFAAPDERERERRVPDGPRPHVLVFYRGYWCPWCNGQLAALGRRFDDVRAIADTAVFGISVDPSERGRALRDELMLPFALLSDPAGAVVRRYGVWSDDERHSLPATVVFDATGTVRYVHVGIDFTDRPDEAELLAALAGAA